MVAWKRYSAMGMAVLIGFGQALFLTEIRNGWSQFQVAARPAGDGVREISIVGTPPAAAGSKGCVGSNAAIRF